MNHYTLDEVHKHLGCAMTHTYYCPEEWDGKSLPKIYNGNGQILATWQRGHNRFTVFSSPLQSNVSLSSLLVFDTAGFNQVKMFMNMMY
ncbi:hypothetical protein LU196_13090 [Pantoea sp. Mb-10]|uniref:hypothetical protein n=1 Tax=unclassified Pantoea TaxID=2630326 RepID=UPI001E470A81|nr:MULTISPECIES: hypothetical protein [unclassified Pantoea]MCE0490975.1 hypothetical protein [Pantoea sp. Mb-10]MCE0499867.1 hypothetical protein [Pantoea sp. Pb-8]